MSSFDVGDVALRFVLGGAIVSTFALCGEIFKPKTFGGLFGAAPSVAVATIGLAFVKDGASHVVLEARTMVLGAIGLIAYALACVMIARSQVHVWLGAGLAWIVWAVTSGALFLGLRALGRIP